jgi:hypothetical protein
LPISNFTKIIQQFSSCYIQTGGETDTATLTGTFLVALAAHTSKKSLKLSCSVKIFAEISNI